MYTKEDYFEHHNYGYGYSESIADLQAQDDIDDVMHGLVRILKELGYELGSRSEWSYSCQCRGLYVDRVSYERAPYPLKDEYPLCQMWCDQDFVKEWMRHYYTINGLWKVMTRFEDLMYELEWVADDEVYYALYVLYDNLHERAVEVYEKALEEALNDVCHVAEKLMDECCDYRYSDEAAEEWVDFQNEEETYMMEQRAIRDFEEMRGQTAKYELYTV